MSPQAIVFLSSLCIMVLEIVAGRLIARHLGNSVYTWTSVIGIILAGISIGNFVGGILSDKFDPVNLLGVWFLTASVSAFFILPLNSWFSESSLLVGYYWPIRTLITIFIIFSIPAIVLGAISPTAARIALYMGGSVGKTIGSVYAWGALGSIAGTFLTGFWLIAVFGSKTIIISIAFLLGLSAVSFRSTRLYAAIWCILLLFLLLAPSFSGNPVARISQKLGISETPDMLVDYDTNYQRVSVWEDMSEVDPSRILRVLQLDHLIHGYIDLDDPNHLEYPYERIYEKIIKKSFQNRSIDSAFFIGGGSYTFPRWLQLLWPMAQIDVAEIDPGVFEANFLALGLPRSTAN